MLFTWLQASLSDAVLPRVLGCKHSYEVWDKVHTHFQSLLCAKVRQLRSELKNTKKESRSISEYLLRIKAIVNSLKAIGDTVSENEHINAMLEGLPQDYSSFVMMIYSRPDPSSVDVIDGLLMVQEAQFDKFKQELAPPVMFANIAHTSKNPNSSQGDLNQGTDQSSSLRGGRGRPWRGRGRGRGRGGPRPNC